MIQIRTDQGDAAGFIANVDLLLRGITTTQAPKDLILIRIDNWFGPKWLRFSGKILGAAGLWNKTLTVPPFVPNRVVSERRLSAPTYDERPNRQPLHVSVSSERATYRYPSLEAHGAALSVV